MKALFVNVFEVVFYDDKEYPTSANGSRVGSWLRMPEEVSLIADKPPFYHILHVVPEHDSYRHTTKLNVGVDVLFESDCTCAFEYEDVEGYDLVVVHNCIDPEVPQE